ncbi:MAG: HU family DNA-binding protein [Bacteroidaceae bacterium]|nr:HU family DNA-binding protein [Bacteroidaceae bacterium]
MAKINLQQLAKTMAQKKGISQRSAEAFLREFFDGIVQNVSTEKLVKVKGLGTFKLIEVQDRESVNIKSGERIIIRGHSKISFTPETSLRDLVNKPFADFQSVVINEGTSIEDMERLPEDAKDVEEEMSDIIEEAAEQTAPEVPTALMSEAKSEPEPEAKSEPVVESEPEPEVESDPKPAPAPSEEKKGSRLWVWMLALVLLLVLALLAYKMFSGSAQKGEVASPAQPQVETPVEEAPALEPEFAQVPGGEYKIVGTRKVYVMQPGDYLAKIAREEYGDKEYAKYIIVHNAFADPDSIAVNMEIKLPELEKIE